MEVNIPNHTSEKNTTKTTTIINEMILMIGGLGFNTRQNGMSGQQTP